MTGGRVSRLYSTSRYQYSNHLGSVGLELDGSGQLISYEEFHPYGSTAYRAANSAIEVSASRYRHTGQERDEEIGLGHHGARYYAGWLGRWTSADPIGLGDGVNRYAYVGGRPIGLRDTSGTYSEPLQQRIDQYVVGAAIHNSRVETWHGQVRVFDPGGENAEIIRRNLLAERDVLVREEAMLWNRWAMLSNAVAAEEQERRLADEYENGGPEATNLSGQTRGRIAAGAKISLGATVLLSGGTAGLLIGGDFLQAGLRQAPTGEDRQTVLRGGTALVSEALGSSPTSARIHGDMAETLVPAVHGGWRAGSAMGTSPRGAGPYGTAARTRPRPAKPAAGEGVPVGTLDGVSIPATAGARTRLPGRLAQSDLAALQAQEGVEFAQVYVLGPGRGGGAGRYYLVRGTEAGAVIPGGRNVILINHSHPTMLGGQRVPLRASSVDQEALKSLQRMGSPQRTSEVVPEVGEPFRFDIHTKRKP